MKKLSAILAMAFFVSANAPGQVNQGSGAGSVQNPGANGGTVSVTSNQGVGANNAATIVPVPEVNYQTTGGTTAFACQEDQNRGDWDVRCIRGGVSWVSNPSQALINTIQAAECYRFVNGGPAGPVVHIPAGSYSIGGNISLPPGMDVEGAGGSQYGFLTILTTTDPTQAMFTHVGSETFNCNGTNYTDSAGMSTLGNVILHGGGSANANDIGLLNGTGGSSFEYLHNVAFQFFGGPGRTVKAGANGQNARGSNIWANSDLQWYYNSGSYNASGFTDTNPHCALELGDTDSHWDHVEVTGQLMDSGYYNRYYLSNVCLGSGGQAETFTQSYLQLAPHNIWMYASANGGQRVYGNRFDGGWWDSVHIAGSPGSFYNNNYIGYCTSPTLNPANFASNPGGVTTDANCAAIEDLNWGGYIGHESIGPSGLWSQWPIWSIWVAQNTTGQGSTVIDEPGAPPGSIGGWIGGDPGDTNVGADVSRSMLNTTSGNYSNLGGTIHFKGFAHTFLNDSTTQNYTAYDGTFNDTYVSIEIRGSNDTVTPSGTIVLCSNSAITSGLHWFHAYNNLLTEMCPSETAPADGEVPAGVIDGTNVTFTLAIAPNPASSLHLYRNGLRLSSPADYTISGNTITYQNPPSPGDTHVADYSF